MNGARTRLGAVFLVVTLCALLGAKGGKDRSEKAPSAAPETEQTSEDNLYLDLEQFFQGTEVDVGHVGGRTYVNFPVSLLFTDPYSIRLRQEAASGLDLLATVLRLHPERDLTIIGHVDNALLPQEVRQRHGNHLNVGFRYAEVVHTRLSTEFNLQQSRFTVATRGEFEPVASNDTASGQKQNRRVVVWVLPPPPAD